MRGVTFRRKQVLEPRSLDLNTLVEALSPVLTRLAGAEIELVILPGQGLGQVTPDPGQLDLVVMNLLVNARDAMAGTGTLRIETDNRDLKVPLPHKRGDPPRAVRDADDAGHRMRDGFDVACPDLRTVLHDQGTR